MDAVGQRYIALWAVLGAACIALVVLVGGLPPPDLALTATLIVATALAERVELSFDFRRAAASFTLIEVMVTAGLLLLPAFHAVAVAVLGTVLAQLLRRLDAVKVVFSAGQTAAGVSVASLLLTATPAVGPQVAGSPVLGVVLGMGGYVALNVLAIVGLFQRIGGDEASEGIRAHVRLTAATMVGQVATGIVLAALALVDLALVPFVFAPAGAVYLAARGATRTTDLLTRVRADRDRLTRVIDGASDGILLLDRDGTVQVWNPAMEHLTGITDRLAVGRPVAEVLTDDVRIARQPIRDRWLLDDAHDGAPRRELDATLVHRDGARRSTRESHALVFDDRGRCTGDVVVVRDVTRQQELERLRSDFVARVSHELRTPLTPIRGFASVLLRRGEQLTAEQRSDALERIVERADHLGELVEDLLLVTRLDRGQLDDVVQVRPIDVRGAVEASVERARSREPGRTIVLHVAPAVGKALADPARVEQVLGALLDNALRYPPAATPIEVGLDQQGDDVRIRVHDHGPGVPREQREVIFERFTRLEDPLRMRTTGVGLGLFLARQLATAMHGSISLVEAEPGNTTFELLLPTAEPAVESATGTAT